MEVTERGARALRETPVTIFMNDPRMELLVKLRAHVARGLDAQEAAMAVQMIRFVTENPRCAERSLEIGHLTGSAWIVDAARKRTLLTHHRKLEMWVQLGGHADGDAKQPCRRLRAPFKKW